MRLPATPGAPSLIASAMQAALRSQAASFCDSHVAFACELLLREALNNAVFHGSHNEGATVDCTIRAKRGRILILVQDEGSGFDWRPVLHRETHPSEPGGRGLEIYRKYANLVRFNEKGNAVALLRHLNGISPV